MKRNSFANQNLSELVHTIHAPIYTWTSTYSTYMSLKTNLINHSSTVPRIPRNMWSSDPEGSNMCILYLYFVFTCHSLHWQPLAGVIWELCPIPEKKATMSVGVSVTVVISWSYDRCCASDELSQNETSLRVDQKQNRTFPVYLL